MRDRRLGLPQHGGGPSGSNGVQRKKDAAAVLRSAILEQFLPHGTLAPIGSPFVPRRQTVIEESRVGGLFVLGHVRRLFGKEGGEFVSSPGVVDEAGGDDAGIVAALEGVGLLAGAGVAVEVFLLWGDVIHVSIGTMLKLLTKKRESPNKTKVESPGNKKGPMKRGQVVILMYE